MLEKPPRHVTERRTRCQNCYSFVSVTFARVFGDNDNQIHGCPACMNLQTIRNGAATEERSVRSTAGHVVHWESSDS